MEKSSRKPLSWIVVLLLVAVFVAASYGLAQLLKRNETTRLTQAIKLPALPTQYIWPYKDGLIYYDGTVLHALNGAGEQIWPYSAGADSQFFTDSGIVAAWSGTSLAFLDGSGAPIYSDALEDKVLSARAGKHFLVAQVGEQLNSTLVVIERSSGKQIDRISLENKTLLDYGFFSEDRMLWVMLLDTEGTMPVSSVTTYRPGKTQHRAAQESDQILYHAMFDETDMITIGTSYIKHYDYTGAEIEAQQRLVYGWYMVDEENGKMAFVPTQQADGGLRAKEIRILSDSSDRAVHMPFECKAVFVSKGKIYGFSDKYVMEVTENSKSMRTKELPIQADQVLGITDSQSAIVISGEGVYLVPLNA